MIWFNLDVANSDNGTINNKYYHPVSESDLYDYIRTEFYLGDYGEPISPKKEGGQWIYWASTKLKDKERKGHLSNNLAYFPDGLTKISKKRLSEKEEKSKKQADEQAEEQVEKQVTNEFADKSLSIDLVDDENITKWGFDISSLGLYLFRNGFGFLWYEIKLDTDANADSISAPDLEIFQNRIKELNFKNGEVWFWEKIDKIPIVGIDLGKESSEKADHEYYKPFCMGTWINEKLCFLSPEYIAKRNYSSPECKFRSNGAANSHRRCACFGFIGAEHRPMGSFSWYYQARMLIPFISSLRLCRLSVSRDKTASA